LARTPAWTDGNAQPFRSRDEAENPRQDFTGPQAGGHSSRAAASAAVHIPCSAFPGLQLPLTPPRVAVVKLSLERTTLLECGQDRSTPALRELKDREKAKRNQRSEVRGQQTANKLPFARLSHD